MNILVLCTGNSARSILLEAILGADPRVTAFSAGSTPAGRVHPAALALLDRKGIATGGFRSKSWDEFGGPDAPEMDAVITVCGNAAGEVCPVWPGTPLRAHWGVEDPAAAPEPEWETAFETAWTRLLARGEALLALDIAAMPREDLQSALTRIGRTP